MRHALRYFDCLCETGPIENKDPAAPWTTEDILACMDWCEIDGALLGHTMSRREDPMTARSILADEIAKAPDRLFPIWSAMPNDAGDTEDPTDLIGAMRAADVRAIKLFPASHGFPTDISVIGPLLESLRDAGAPVFLDATEFGGDADRPFHAFHEIASNFPTLILVAQRFGWGQQRVALALLDRHENIHIEFSKFQCNRGLEVCARRYGAERLLFGSGLPAMSAGAARAYIDYADISDEARQLIAGGNLSRLLGGVRPAPFAPPPEADEDKLRAAVRLGLPVEDSPVLDAHCHVLPEGSNSAGRVVMYRGDAKGLIEIADRMGTRTTAMMSWSGPIGGDMPRGNETVRRAMSDFPDKVVGVAYFNCTHYSPAELLAELRLRFDEQGFLGVKPYRNVGAPYDDPLWAPVWDFANDRGLYALLHIGGFDMVRRMADRYPDMVFLLAHSGASWERARAVAQVMNEKPNVWAEVTLTPVTNGAIEYLATEGDENRVVYGTDAPMRDPRPQFGWVAWARLPEATRRKILGENFVRLIEKVRRAKASPKSSEP